MDRIHEFDYLQWLCGPTERVLAISGKHSALEIDSEDVVEVILQFKSGVIRSIHLDYLQQEYTCQLKAIGETGALEWKFNPTSVRVFTQKQPEWRTVFSDSATDVNTMYIEEMKAFLECVRSRTQPVNGLPEAARTLKMALEAKGIL